MYFLYSIHLSLHPSQLRYILHRKLVHAPLHKHDFSALTPTQKTCFAYLDKTGRSYSAVIKELHPEILLSVAIFYLILRGLDTIEDDGSIPAQKKAELLRDFKDVLEIEGWNFDGNREGEKDRDLLVNFHDVITEYKGLNLAHREILRDITGKMGAGMAEYIAGISIETIPEYDEYCWYVAGLVGEGLTRLFAETGFVDPGLLDQTHLHRSMGLLLQKTNIIRDVHEDHCDGRRFWPEEIFREHVEVFDDLFKTEPCHRESALNCTSHMVLNALSHVEDCLSYVLALNEPSIFNFCAIPQAMALATLELCLRNPALFERNLKISKGDALRIMSEVEGQGMHGFGGVILRYIRRIQERSVPKDPSFVELRTVCARIEKAIDTLLHSQNAKSRKYKDVGVGADFQGAASQTLLSGKALAASTLMVAIGAFAIGHFYLSSGLSVS
ncbi:hypothetical protein BDV06DRAFT_235018 [Aspergillus oleicola]